MKRVYFALLVLLLLCSPALAEKETKDDTVALDSAAAEAAEEKRGNLVKSCLTLARAWHLANKERIVQAAQEDPSLEAKVINKAFTGVVNNCIELVGQEDEAALFKDRFVPFEVDHTKFSEYINVELDSLLTGDPDVFNLTPEENAIIPEIEQASRELAD